MNLANELMDYYECQPSVYIKNFITNLESKNDEFKQAFLDYIFENQPKKFGLPDIAFLKKALNAIPDVSFKPKKLVWQICPRCKEAYDNRLCYCPCCWIEGKKITSNICSTGYDYPDSIHLLNIGATTNNILTGKNCYDCETQTYCKNFGNEKWECSRNDFETCPCARCCAIIKKHNREENVKVENLKQKRWE